jgi:hypothetical protein
VFNPLALLVRVGGFIEFMSEFQFPCPKCRQPVLCAEEHRGLELTCPHCSGNITAPAPAGTPGNKPGSKLGVTATTTAHDQPKPQAHLPLPAPPPKKKNSQWVPVAVTAFLVVGAAAVVYLNPDLVSTVKDKIGLGAPVVVAPTNAPPAEVAATNAPPPPPPKSPPASWSLDKIPAPLPNYAANGVIMSNDFLVDVAHLDKTPDNKVTLSLRQGTGSVPDRDFMIYLRLDPGEGLDGKQWSVAQTDKVPPPPPVVKQWRPDARYGPQSKWFRSGYAMKLQLGTNINNKISGSIYLALPDDDHSFVAGAFSADVRNIQPPAPGQAPNNPPPATTSSSQQSNSRRNTVMSPAGRKRYGLPQE